MRLFVYGTLMRGRGNNHILTRTGAAFLGPATSTWLCRMADVGFPYVQKTPMGFVTPLDGFVSGELWEATDETIEQTDRLEGVPDHYYRSVEEFSDHTFKTVTAHVYLVRQLPGGSWSRNVQPDNSILRWHR